MNASIIKNEILSPYTTFKIGGKADFFAEPKSYADFLNVLEWNSLQNLPLFFFGGGSNLVVSDDGIAGLVICSKNLSNLEFQANQSLLVCECGCTFEKIQQFCECHGLSGFENFAGLPGSVGGALYMNARCYEKSICELVHSIDFLDVSKNVRTYTFNPIDWDYKKSPFQNSENIILTARFRVEIKNSQEIVENNNFFITDRKEKKHFDFPSAGSVFKNNRTFGVPSGKLIDEAGLRGHSIGNAQIAPWHGNFIINRGCAKANDVANLVDFIKETVYKQFGFMLEPEILFVGK